MPSTNIIKVLLALFIATVAYSGSGTTSRTTLVHAKEKNQAGSVRVYRFDNLDVEGKVKTPQLMYFLKRIRSRFRSFRLPKQQFTKRIIESADESFL